MMNLPPLPEPTLPTEAAHTWAQAAYCKALERPGPDIDEAKAALAQAMRTYAEQYGRLCAEAEREACAEICKEHGIAFGAHQKAHAAFLCEHTIRARSK